MLSNICVVPFAIVELGQKCLEAAPTRKYGPLNSCITVLSVLIIKIFQGCASPLALIEDEKIVKNQDNGLKVPLFDFSKCQV